MSSTTSLKFILGTHMIGDSIKSPGIVKLDSEKDVQALLDAFHSRGYRNIDTASNYPVSEARLGQVGAPARFTMHTKVNSGKPGDHEPSKVSESIRQSLSDLKTSTVETMFLHVPDRQTPFENTIKAMDDAFKQGQFKRFGLSNYSAAEVQKILEICEQKGYNKPSVYQGHYNAIVRGGEKELFPLLRKHGMAFWAYSPAAGGLFADHAASSTRWSNENIIGKLYGALYGQSPVQASVATVRNAAEKQGISGHAAAVRWTAFHGALDGNFEDGVIIGASKIEQLQKTLDAIEAGPLPSELAEAITALYSTVEGSEPPYHL